MALDDDMVFEVRDGGHDDNGAAFNSTATGTDRSQQTSPHVTFNGTTVTATTAGVSDTITITGYTVLDPGDIGNVLKTTGGTNFVADERFEVRAVNTGANTWQLDRNITTGAGSGLTGRMGGCAATPGEIARHKIASNIVWLKRGASNYLISSSSNVSGGRITDATSATTAKPSRWQGYDVTRGDFTGNKPVLEANASSITIFTINGNIIYLDNIEFFRNSGGGLTGVVGVQSNGVSNSIARCNFLNLNGAAGALQLTTILGFANQCFFDECTLGLEITGGRCEAFWCTGEGGATHFSTAGTGGGEFNRCISANATDTGFSLSAGGSVVKHCTVYSADGTNGGFYFNAGSGQQAICCLSYGNTNDGFKNNTAEAFLTNCAAGGNGGSDQTGFASGAVQGFVTLTANPFIDAAAGNFGLNGVPGGGLACRGTGVPGIFPGIASTGFPDIGAVQGLATGFVRNKYSICRRSFG
jgi:hypothetical protein